MFSSASFVKKMSIVTDGENNIETVWGRGYELRDPEPVKDKRLSTGASWGEFDKCTTLPLSFGGFSMAILIGG
jgi:hypothetical protein